MDNKNPLSTLDEATAAPPDLITTSDASDNQPAPLGSARKSDQSTTSAPTLESKTAPALEAASVETTPDPNLIASDYAASTTFNFAAANEFSNRKAPTRAAFDKPVYNTGFNTAVIPTDINHDTIAPKNTATVNHHTENSSAVNSNTINSASVNSDVNATTLPITASATNPNFDPSSPLDATKDPFSAMHNTAGPIVFTSVKKKSRLKLAVAAAIATIIVGGIGGTFAVFAWRNKPENIAASALTQLISTPSVHLKGETKFSLVEKTDDSQGLEAVIVAILAGLLDEVKITTDNTSQHLPDQHNLSIRIPFGKNTEHALSLGFNSLILDDGAIYAQIKGISESLDSSTAFASDLDFLKSDQASRFRTVLEQLRSELKSDTSKLKKTLDSVENQWWRIKFSELIESTQVDKEVKTAAKAWDCLIGKFKDATKHKQSVADTYKKHPFITLEKASDQGKVTGGNTRYKIKLLVDKFSNFLSEYEKTPFASDLKTCVPEEERSAFPPIVRGALDEPDGRLISQKETDETAARERLKTTLDAISAGLLLDIDNWSHQIKHLSYNYSPAGLPLQITSKYDLTYANIKQNFSTPGDSLPITDLPRKLNRITEEVTNILSANCGNDITTCFDLSGLLEIMNSLSNQPEKPTPKQPEPEKPTPLPEVKPSPTPNPVPAPAPAPTPKPKPRPRPEPIPVPRPIPSPQPVPENDPSDPLIHIQPIKP